MEKKEASYSVSEDVNWQPVMKTVWWFLKKMKIKLLYDPAVPLSGIFPEKNIRKDACILLFIAALLTIANTWKHLKCLLTGEWVKKM